MSKIRSARKFVREHKTLVACGATAVGTYYLTRDLKVRGLGKAIDRLEYQRLATVSDLGKAIEGVKSVDLEHELEYWNLWEFINAKKLRDDYFDFVKRNGINLVKGSPEIEYSIM